ncbi:MAG TPA: ATP-dependent DNA ligase, partial [Bauldia sp.]|nr:ATP-dependent DNA ligase [Bauldia sp.]
MQAFASLLDRLVLTPQRNVKLRLLVDYFRNTPDPDRGYALGALTGELVIPSVKPAMLRALVTERVDDVLFAYSYDYVGDLAETMSLVWRPKSGDHPVGARPGDDLRLATI